MNRHQFELTAKQFRAGRIRLDDFADLLFGQKQVAAEAGLLPRLPVRADDAHKGDFGHLLVIAGSRRMAGAAALTALAAARSGVGLVTVATPESARSTVAAASPALMVAGLPETVDGELADWPSAWNENLLARATAVVIGPGLGVSDAVRQLVQRLYRECSLPVLIDADGLNALAQSADWDPAAHAGPRVLTPHPGELKRLAAALCGWLQTQSSESGSNASAEESPAASSSSEVVPADRLADGEDFARRLAATAKVVVVAKSHRTLVVDGDQSVRQERPQSGLAKAGSGDVLAGLIGGLLAQRAPAGVAAISGCGLHSLAGAAAVQKWGARSVLSADFIEHLPEAFRRAETDWSPAART